MSSKDVNDSKKDINKSENKDVKNKDKKHKKKHERKHPEYVKKRVVTDNQGDTRYVPIQNREDVRVTPNSKIEDYLKPYRASLIEKTEAVIAKLNIDLTKSGSSSTLGRFASQVILEKSREYSKLPVDFALLNNGGLRKPLYKGDIKIKDIYELMPFDNYIVVVSVNGSEVKKMCNEIKRHHGLPMAGITIITGETDKDSCKVNNKEIDEKKEYLIATINYLYNVGEGVPSLKNGKLVKNMTNRLFRDAIIEYFKEKKVINKTIPINYHVMRN
jgi:2',3'-cyclic-nucleotide 2'-phosphodiesterase (5'-nucleotidase family)